MAIEARFRHWTQAQAAQLMGCSRPYVCKLVKAGKLGYVERFGRKWITAEALEAYLLKRAQQRLPGMEVLK